MDEISKIKIVINMNSPLISVVTVSYNAVDTIERTILSVLNQTYSDIEYIIIDGGSTDGTVDLIKKYADKITYWVSEPDQGIYDAMNKGIDVATGEWINFMNSGDSFYRQDVLSSLFDKEIQGDVICGSTHLIEKWGSFTETPLDLSCMKEKKPFCHQSALVRLKWMKTMKFDIRYRICADYDFFYKLWKQNIPFVYTSVIVSNYDRSIGSFSGNSFVKAIQENGQISLNGGAFQSFVTTRKIICIWLRKFLVFVLPHKIWVKRKRKIMEKKDWVVSCDWMVKNGNENR